LKIFPLHPAARPARALAALGITFALAACGSSGPAPAPATAAPTPAPSKAQPPAAPKVAAPDASEAQQKVSELQRRMGQVPPPEKSVAPATSVILVDPKTGQKLERIVKTPSVYEVDGLLYSALMRGIAGIEIVRQDAEAFYVAAPADPTPEPESPLPKETGDENKDLVQLRDIPLKEAEKVEPVGSKSKLRFVELSGGLPETGMWKENFVMADMDGDGRPEIVTPPPRLSGKEIQIFKLTGKEWSLQEAVFEDPEQVGFEYGGVAVADLDGDGKKDIVFGRHGGGPAIALNKGGWKFRVEGRGLHIQMSTRALAIGDLDADGKPDVMALSDDPEYVNLRQAESEGNHRAREPRPDGSLLGYDARAFFNRGEKFVEASNGLNESCFGYTLDLVDRPSDGGRPFYTSSCRYQGNVRTMWEYDRAGNKFVPAGEGAVEWYASHVGSVAGTYQGHPAAFLSYIKNGPQGAIRQISGNGVSVYYRTPEGWKGKRILKTIEQPSVSQGLAAGDLNGDGLDDVVYADDVRHRLRIFFQRTDGEFEELAEKSEPVLFNHTTCVRLADVDGDGKLDVVLMLQYQTGDETRAGGLRVFRTVP